MKYFYDYFACEYRKRRQDKLLPEPAAIVQGIGQEDVQSCRRVLKSAFAGYHDGRNAEPLKQLLGKYREYVSGCCDEHIKARYNAFVYRYMFEVPVGNRVIAKKLGITKETVLNYVNRCIDEMLVLCMGVPAAADQSGDREALIRMLVDGSRLFRSIAGDYVLCLFLGRRERLAVERGRKITRYILEQLEGAVEAYSGYCNDGHTRIDTDIRKAEVLHKCLAGVTPAAIAEEYGCCEGTIYADIRENERRLAAMLFMMEGEDLKNGTIEHA